MADQQVERLSQLVVETKFLEMVAELEYLQTAVAAVLGFVGCKMVAEFGGMEVSTEASLAVVAGMLGAGVALSVYNPSEGKEARGEGADEKE